MKISHLRKNELFSPILLTFCKYLTWRKSLWSQLIPPWQGWYRLCCQSQGQGKTQGEHCSRCYTLWVKCPVRYELQCSEDLLFFTEKKYQSNKSASCYSSPPWSICWINTLGKQEGHPQKVENVPNVGRFWLVRLLFSCRKIFLFLTHHEFPWY